MPRIRFQKLPGNHKQRNRARHLLKCHEVMPHVWTVWGGENSHTVKLQDGEFECSCKIFTIENKLCSHIIKVMMELNQFPTEPKRVKK